MSSRLGISEEKILALEQFRDAEQFDERETVALEYADAMTLSDQDVDDALFARVAEHFDADAIVELTAVIAWENASSKFNRALRVPSQELWQQGQG